MDMHLYLIKRGSKPWYHRAPYHPVIICTRVDVAKQEAGSTSDLAWAWEKHDADRFSGWDLCVWNGLQLIGPPAHRDYRLPDGTKPGVVHDQAQEPWTLLAGAVWWSTAKLPTWMQEAGVVYPPDGFTRQRILDEIANDGAQGFTRQEPAHWPPVAEAQ